ncbi:hypothetical protein PYCC9005_003114 [Savitreella phatthalungensis]
MSPDVGSLTVGGGSAALPFVPVSRKLTRVLEVDAKSKDAHVERDERMVRLTGNHPFNAEAPLSALWDQGFITPPELFFVRNHGACPGYTEQECIDWEIEVCGLVEKPFRLSLRDLIAEFEQITLPVTIVCAGNRRKEQNVVRKGSGFNWGAAGVSTSLWTGPLLRDIIGRAVPKRAGKFVCFTGDDSLPNGNYETCVSIGMAMSFERAIMLAYKQNGETLKPDHGRPLRVIVPGCIGGRSVKWLKRITVTAEPSDNFYHINDNRVLPTLVTPEMAKAEKHWWQDERYAIYNLNVQSAICKPAHDERVTVVEGQDYEVEGYAYNGGGVRVGRVELSTDGGRTWRLAEIEYPEDRYREYEGELYGGKVDMWKREQSWCWCFWRCSIPTTELAASKSGLVVRAMDVGMNAQPRDMYWNVMSMLNNCWFRVATHIEEDGELRFEHPTQPALQPGGWMERVKDAGGDLQAHGWGELLEDSQQRSDTAAAEKPAKKLIKMTRDGINRIVTHAELLQHRNEESCWFVNHGEVYDATPFLREHPGGVDSITMVGGEDCTDDFMAIHSETAKLQLQDYHIGTLELLTPPMSSNASDAGGARTPRPVFLEPKVWHDVELVERTILSKDSRLLRFKLDHDDQLLGLPCGQHLFLKTRCPKTDDLVMRAYTPVSAHDARGFLDVLVKVYFATDDWPLGGKMTNALDALRPGDRLSVKGPTGHFEYHGHGNFTKSGALRTKKNFWMVAGGSGITPVYQVIRQVHNDPKDPTRCTLLDSNRFEEDILCRNDLDRYGTRGGIDIVHTLSGKELSPEWTGLKGRLTTTLLDDRFPHDLTSDALLMVCGPPQLEAMVKEWAKARGMPEDDVLVF